MTHFCTFVQQKRVKPSLKPSHLVIGLKVFAIILYLFVYNTKILTGSTGETVIFVIFVII